MLKYFVSQLPWVADIVAAVSQKRTLRPKEMRQGPRSMHLVGAGLGYSRGLPGALASRQ